VFSIYREMLFSGSDLFWKVGCQTISSRTAVVINALYWIEIAYHFDNHSWMHQRSSWSAAASTHLGKKLVFPIPPSSVAFPVSFLPLTSPISSSLSFCLFFRPNPFPEFSYRRFECMNAVCLPSDRRKLGRQLDSVQYKPKPEYLWTLKVNLL